jgi:hypothetical protein
MTSPFLVQIGYLSRENQRSCKLKDPLPRPEHGKAEKIRRRYEQPEWSKYIRAEERPKSRRTHKVEQIEEERVRKGEASEKAAPKTIRIFVAKKQKRCSLWKLIRSLFKEEEEEKDLLAAILSMCTAAQQHG